MQKYITLCNDIGEVMKLRSVVYYVHALMYVCDTEYLWKKVIPNIKLCHNGHHNSDIVREID